ncbi:MAG: hypothetical protein V3S81_01225, partial [Anaerolineales bacterium]
PFVQSSIQLDRSSREQSETILGSTGLDPVALRRSLSLRLRSGRYLSLTKGSGPSAKRSGHAADGQAWEPDLLEN